MKTSPISTISFLLILSSLILPILYIECTFELEKLENQNDLKELKQLIKNHKKFTGSAVATRILKDWNNSISKFVKVMPTDYKRVMMELNETKLRVS